MLIACRPLRFVHRAGMSEVRTNTSWQAFSTSTRFRLATAATAPEEKGVIKIWSQHKAEVRLLAYALQPHLQYFTARSVCPASAGHPFLGEGCFICHPCSPSRGQLDIFTRRRDARLASISLRRRALVCQHSAPRGRVCSLAIEFRRGRFRCVSMISCISTLNRLTF